MREHPLASALSSLSGGLARRRNRHPRDPRRRRTTERLSADLAVAGKPSKDALRLSQGRRFQDRDRPPPAGRGRPPAREAVEAQGLTFVSVPVSPDTFSAGDAEEGRHGAEGPGRGARPSFSARAATGWAP